MKIKLIASDLDGTLLNNDSMIDMETRQTVKKLKDYGIEFVIATGRSFEGAFDVVRQLDMTQDSMGMICVNGLQTFSIPELSVTQEQSMTFDECIELSKLGEAYYMGVMYCFEDALYFQMDDLSYQDYMIALGDDSKHFFNRRLDTVFISGIEEIRDKFIMQPIQKIAFLQSQDYMSLVIDRMRARAPEGYQFLRVGMGWTEIMHDHIDKGTALLKYAASKGIDASEIMAFGDSENDLEMLKKVGVPVAMSNAMENILSIDNIKVIESNEACGVAKEINRYLSTL